MILIIKYLSQHKVINTFKNAPSFKWRKIKFSRTGLKESDKRDILRVNSNHQVLARRNEIVDFMQKI